MSRLKKFFNIVICKYGTTIACFAFIAATVSANTACCGPFYEPEEPAGLKNFKKFDR